ncbi:1,2-dihydroxy-3-keto-5-methylthiopentene dioxygenase [Actinokineospora sp. G85]|uniref:1,2-dihydroxy-3-keto-5-methylthiopentene dioxygenase n=1 Tax=Actinokineospora sp. G85 TaxID=3406626 RepID=UPI003C77D97E
MTLLTVWPEDDPTRVLVRTTDFAEIVDVLRPLGVRFSRWPLADLPAAPTPEQVLAAYRERIDEVNAQEGYTHVDAVALSPETSESDRRAARAKFLTEHTHDDDEDRFFAKGSGVFYLHVDAKVHAVLCEAGDLLSVPAKTTHWFDMGTAPDYISVRFFHDDEGWVASFREDSIAHAFPTYDELAASRD